MIKASGLLVCTHKCTQTELLTKAHVTIPNAPNLLQFCDPTMGTIHLPAYDTAGCTAKELQDADQLRQRLEALDIKDSNKP